MLIQFVKVTHAYQQPTGQITALEGIDMGFHRGEFVAVLGPSGAGKSTLLLHFNGLLRPTSGQVLYKHRDIHAKGNNLKALRSDVGLLFQTPENNFFGQTVFEDISYGPVNHGLKGSAVENAVDRALEQVGLSLKFKARSPFSLSGGEKRKVALAGILATEPKVLVLDEPLAGLDAKGKASLMELLQDLNRQGITVIMVTHDLAETLPAVSRIVVLAQGKVQVDGSARDILADFDFEAWNLETPELIKLGRRLGLTFQGNLVATEEEAVQAILARKR
ncbi:MAG TPA: ATP-binding cassette domain-containing protein [Verrucomicrobiae bacterium]|nr:ATP-binding cassette domain-containing protein [Verrucomicrobiae bacterium]